MEGKMAHRTAVYLCVHEDFSTGSTRSRRMIMESYERGLICLWCRIFTGLLILIQSSEQIGERSQIPHQRP
ncbi:MAG: hypothetical protein LBJ92_03755 [Holosporales bacterium]|nr:hypothetical protein [Holosporales bacterium]